MPDSADRANAPDTGWMNYSCCSRFYWHRLVAEQLASYTEAARQAGA